MKAAKAWYGGAVAAIATTAGILVAIWAVVNPADVATVVPGVPTEAVLSWWRILGAALGGLAGGGVTAGVVYQATNKPK